MNSFIFSNFIPNLGFDYGLTYFLVLNSLSNIFSHCTLGFKNIICNIIFYYAIRIII